MTALAVTLAIQAFTSLAATATAVLAPEVGSALGLNPKLIGAFIGMLYLGAMLASLASGSFIERYGPIRVSQVCVILCAFGLALTTGPAWGLLFAPILIGIGYGPITPASSQLLARTTSPNAMALTFSIKQTGVPLGAALAGALLPLITISHGWRAATWAVAAGGVAVALLAQPTRTALDIDLVRQPYRALGQLFAPLKIVMRSPKLIELTTTAFVYAATQACLLTFLVIYMQQELGRTLVDAGLMLTVATVGGILGRISWGMVADRWIAPRKMLGMLGMVAGGCALVMSSFGPSWPALGEGLVCALFGVTAIGWNGVQLAEVARHAPRGQAGAITGASGFITFAGVVVGPPAFALVASVTGSYATGFAMIGIGSLACGTWLLWRGTQAAVPRAGE
jgi:MFS family permease